MLVAQCLPCSMLLSKLFACPSLLIDEIQGNISLVWRHWAAAALWMGSPSTPRTSQGDSCQGIGRCGWRELARGLWALAAAVSCKADQTAGSSSHVCCTALCPDTGSVNLLKIPTALELKCPSVRIDSGCANLVGGTLWFVSRGSDNHGANSCTWKYQCCALPACSVPKRASTPNKESILSPLLGLSEKCVVSSWLSSSDTPLKYAVCRNFEF